MSFFAVAFLRRRFRYRFPRRGLLHRSLLHRCLLRRGLLPADFFGAVFFSAARGAAFFGAAFFTAAFFGAALAAAFFGAAFLAAAFFGAALATTFAGAAFFAAASSPPPSWSRPSSPSPSPGGGRRAASRSSCRQCSPVKLLVERGVFVVRFGRGRISSCHRAGLGGFVSLANRLAHVPSWHMSVGFLDSLRRSKVAVH